MTQEETTEEETGQELAPLADRVPTKNFVEFESSSIRNNVKSKMRERRRASPSSRSEVPS